MHNPIVVRLDNSLKKDCGQNIWLKVLCEELVLLQ